MKKIISIVLFLALGLIFTAKGQKVVNVNLTNSQKNLLPKGLTSDVRFANDTLWVSDSSYTWRQTAEGFTVMSKSFVRSRNQLGRKTASYSIFNRIDLNKWVYQGSDSVTYYADSLAKETFNYVWDNSLSSWHLTHYELYNSFAKPLTLIQKDWDQQEHRYIDGSKRTYVYNDNNQVTDFSFKVYNADANTFVNKSRSYYYLDQYGYDSLTVSDGWDTLTQQWVTTNKKVMTYFPIEKKLLSTTYHSNDNGETWLPDDRYTDYSYDGAGYDTLLYSHWQTGYNFWLDISRSIANYDNQGRLVEIVNQDYQFADSLWVNSTRIYYLYDNDLLGQTGNETWNSQNSNWTPQFLTNFIYNNGVVISTILETVQGDSNVMDTTMLLSYTYDNHGNIFSWQIKRPDSNGILSLSSKHQFFWNIFQGPSLVLPEKENRLLVYPNPTSGVLHFVNGSKTEQPIRIQLVDLQGRVLFTKNMQHSTGQIDLTGNPAGIYFLRLSGIGKTVVKQVVIE